MPPSFGLYVKTFTLLGLYLLLFIRCLYLSFYFYYNYGYAPVMFVPLLAIDILFHLFALCLLSGFLSTRYPSGSLAFRPSHR